MDQWVDGWAGGCEAAACGNVDGWVAGWARVVEKYPGCIHLWIIVSIL